MLSPDAQDEIERAAKSLETELIEFRRARHMLPELGRKEHRTTAAIVDRLAKAGLEPRVLDSGTGVVCDIVGTSGADPSLGFRGDIDALPLVDAKHVAYRSRVEGVCHACGHDVHTTVVLGTALVLAELRSRGLLRRSIRLIFQPAEEITPGGALDVIADGAIAGLEHVFALHCDPKVEVGKVGLRVGPITGGADHLQVTMTGPGGHTARPHLTADVVFALGVVITQLPGVLSRTCDPRAGLSVVWGQVHSGAVANAIPQSGFAQGTIRCLDAQVWEAAHELIPDVIRSLAAPYGVDVEIDMHTSVPPCVNDAECTQMLHEAALAMLGADGVVRSDQSLGGEDFAWIAGRTRGSLARLGVRSRHIADIGDLHQPSFDIDEAAISVGVRLFSAVALGQLST